MSILDAQRYVENLTRKEVADALKKGHPLVPQFLLADRAKQFQENDELLKVLMEQDKGPNLPGGMRSITDNLRDYLERTLGKERQELSPVRAPQGTQMSQANMPGQGAGEAMPGPRTPGGAGSAMPGMPTVLPGAGQTMNARRGGIIGLRKGGLTRAYHAGGSLGHSHDPRTGRAIDSDTGDIGREQPRYTEDLGIPRGGGAGLAYGTPPMKTWIDKVLAAQTTTDPYDVSTGERKSISERIWEVDPDTAGEREARATSSARSLIPELERIQSGMPFGEFSISSPEQLAQLGARTGDDDGPLRRQPRSMYQDLFDAIDEASTLATTPTKSEAALAKVNADYLKDLSPDSAAWKSLSYVLGRSGRPGEDQGFGQIADTIRAVKDKRHAVETQDLMRQAGIERRGDQFRGIKLGALASEVEAKEAMRLALAKAQSGQSYFSPEHFDTIVEILQDPMRIETHGEEFIEYLETMLRSAMMGQPGGGGGGIPSILTAMSGGVPPAGGSL